MQDRRAIAEEAAAALMTVVHPEMGEEGTHLCELARSLTAAILVTTREQVQEQNVRLPYYSLAGAVDWLPERCQTDAAVQDGLAMAASDALASLLRLASSLGLHPGHASLLPLYTRVGPSAIHGAPLPACPLLMYGNEPGNMR